MTDPKRCGTCGSRKATLFIPMSGCTSKHHDAFHDTPASEPCPNQLPCLDHPMVSEPTASEDVCHDCGRRYGDEHGFSDLILPNDVWDQISPTRDPHGLLCPSCIVGRCQQLGLKCEAKWFSGPFVDETGGWFTLEHCDARLAEAKANWVYEAARYGWISPEALTEVIKARVADAVKEVVAAIRAQQGDDHE